MATAADRASPRSHLGKHTRGLDEPTASSGGEKLFRCGSCDKSYSRVDHLSRHVRLHTQERPFVCRVCEKSFSRADLLKRHETLHDSAGSREQSSAPRENRVSQACGECARLHIKCDNEKPCRRCAVRGFRCVYPVPAGAEAVTVAHDLLSLATASQFQSVQPDPLIHDGRTLSVPMPDHNVQTSIHENSVDHGTMLPQAPPEQGPGDPRLRSDDGPDLTYWEMPDPPAAEERIHDFLRAVMGGSAGQNHNGATGGILSGTRTPRNIFDFGNEADWSLNDMDLSFLDDYNQHVPFLAASDTGPSTGPAAPDEPDPPSVPPMGVDATRKWRFRPVTKEGSDANLSVPATDAHGRPQYNRRVTTERLSNSTRDHLLTMVATAGSQAQPTASFPSTDLLDSLLQYYLSTTDATTYVCHTPTFDPNRRPILTLSMVSAGAALTPDASLQKLGLVLQEAVRVIMSAMVEKDNTLIRDVEMLQAAYINLKVGFWSGNSRKMEVAESFMQPWATMVRRAGWLGRSKYERIVPDPGDAGDVLQDKWKRWASQESWKRLVLFILQHDAEVSLMLSINPNISYGELHLPLPYQPLLWHASSAQAWKTTFLSDTRYSIPLPSVLDLLKDVDCLATASYPLDVHAASRAVLSAAWGLVREYRQLSGIVSSGPNQWHHGPLLLSSRLAELKKLLECIRLGSPDDPAGLLLLEALSMHLHLSLDDVHLFAGVEGYDEAQRIFPVLKAWVRTPAARQAVFHAGQILRLAKAIPTVRDFGVILVYQATLALWSFGIISGAEGTAAATAGRGRPPPEELTVLTAGETVQVNRFISLGWGSPGVAGLEEGEPALLNDVGGVMQVVKRLLIVKGEQDGRATPKLVENIIDLVEELRRAVSL